MELRKRLRLNNAMEYLQNRRLLWWSSRKTYWPSKCKKLEIGGSLTIGRPTKTWSNVIGRDLEEWKVNKELAKKEILKKWFISPLTYACEENRHEIKWLCIVPKDRHFIQISRISLILKEISSATITKL